MIRDDWHEAWQLHFAVMDGNVEKCAQLIVAGYDINAFDDIGNTPLHYAAEKEHFELVSFLISNGANVNSLDVARIGQTPLAHVAQACSLKMAKMLLDAGADPTLSCSVIKLAKESKRGEGPRVYELFDNWVRGKG